MRCGERNVYGCCCQTDHQTAARSMLRGSKRGQTEVSQLRLFWYYVQMADPSPGLTSTTPPTVLIVDADPHIRELAGHFLSEGGYQVDYALDGYEALDKAKQSRPDLILLELIIPKLNGLALCRLIKTDPVLNSIVIVIHSVLPPLSSAKVAGANAFLSKPVEKTLLLDAVFKAINP
jgi:CheY-like chemotaxis protein